MGYLLCSEKFKTFFDMLQQNVYSAEEMLALVKAHIRPIAEELSVGKFEISLVAPATVYDPNGKVGTLVLYESAGGHGTDKVHCHLETGERGLADATAYALPGYEWDDDEKSDLRFLISRIFILTGRARLMGLMERASVTDSLTGAFNTNGLMQFGWKLSATRQLKEYASIFINLKNFKYINQKAGARRGDAILRAYTQKLMGMLNRDEMIARLGGDNFLVLVKKEHLDAFINVAKNCDVVINMDGRETTSTLTAHMGVFRLREGDTMNDAMNGASIAVSIARHSQRQDVVFATAEMLSKAMHDKEISTLFPNAIKNHEFVVFYQPKVDLEQGKLCGCEALVRWVKDGQLIPPMTFIPLLEREGAVCELDFYVLERACQDIRGWMDAGIEPVRISTNFSKVHLHNAHLAEDILRVISRYGVDPKYIEIELTEMSGHESFDELADFVNHIRKSGVHVSIDDFGTGYSSLSLLKDLKVDLIKLDKSFLDKTDENRKSDTIVIRNVISMIHELGMDIIAEGVETSSQASFLRALNCGIVQGYLFDKPLKKEEFETRLAEDFVYELA